MLRKDSRIPDWFADRLTNAGGTTLSGLPKVRVVHGENARGFPMPDNEALKYVDPNDPLEGWGCFILEEWMPPEFFGDPQEWERQRWALGGDGRRHEIMAPFPSRGEYVFVQPLAAPDGTPFPLTEQIAQYVEWLVRQRQQTPVNTYTNAQLTARRVEAMREAQEQKRREASERLAVIADECATRAEDVNREATRVYSHPSGFTVKDRRATAAKEQE